MSQNTIWNNGELEIIDNDPNILNLTHWDNGEPFGDTIFDGGSGESDNLDGKLIIIRKSSNNLDGHTKVNKSTIDNFDGALEVKDEGTYNLDGNLRVIETTFCNVDGKAILRSVPIDGEPAVDGKITLDDFGFKLDVVWQNGEPHLIKHDSKIIELKYWKNGVQIGDLVYQIDDPTNIDLADNLNGRMFLKDSSIYNLDGDLIISSPIDATEDDIGGGILLGGKIEIKIIPVGLVKILIS